MHRQQIVNLITASFRCIRICIRIVEARNLIELRYTPDGYDPEAQWVGALIYPPEIYKTSKIHAAFGASGDRASVEVFGLIRIKVALIDLSLFPKKNYNSTYDVYTYDICIFRPRPPATRTTFIGDPEITVCGWKYYGLDQVIQIFAHTATCMSDVFGAVTPGHLDYNYFLAYAARRGAYDRLQACPAIRRMIDADDADQLFREAAIWCVKESHDTASIKMRYVVVTELARKKGIAENKIRRAFGQILKIADITRRIS